MSSTQYFPCSFVNLYKESLSLLLLLPTEHKFNRQPLRCLEAISSYIFARVAAAVWRGRQAWWACWAQLATREQGPARGRETQGARHDSCPASSVPASWGSRCSSVAGAKCGEACRLEWPRFQRREGPQSLLAGLCCTLPGQYSVNELTGHTRGMVRNFLCMNFGNGLPVKN